MFKQMKNIIINKLEEQTTCDCLDTGNEPECCTNSASCCDEKTGVDSKECCGSACC